MYYLPEIRNKTNAFDCIFHKMKFTSASTGKTLKLGQKSNKVKFETK